MDMERKIRILMAKPGLDGHDRGIKVLEEMGTGKLFGTGARVQETINYITNWVNENRR